MRETLGATSLPNGVIEHSRANMIIPTLCITATQLEADPLHKYAKCKQLDFPLGSLYQCNYHKRSFYLAHSGVGKVNAAATLALAINKLKPKNVIQFGIGGAFVGSFLAIGHVAVANCEIHLDSGVQLIDNWQDMKSLGFPLVKGERPFYNKIPTDTSLTRELEQVTGAIPCIFGTSESLTGSLKAAKVLQERFDVSIESMEGAAAAQVCLALDVPFAELRSVSNIVGERDKAAWDIPHALGEVNKAIRRFLEH